MTDTVTTRPLVVIDNYDSFTYNLVSMLQGLANQHNIAETVVVYRNNQVTVDELIALKPARIVISPGPGHPANPADFGVCQAIIENQAQLNCPIIGVCLGHQGIATVFGGQVLRAPTIVHGKSSLVQWDDTTDGQALFNGLDNPFLAMRYHSLVVDDTTLPPTLQVLARLQTTQADNGLIMALKHRQLPIYGVQFHPESIGTPMGERLLLNLLTL
jgi:anthranilate synthase component II